MHWRRSSMAIVLSFFEQYKTSLADQSVDTSFSWVVEIDDFWFTIIINYFSMVLARQKCDRFVWLFSVPVQLYISNRDGWILFQWLYYYHKIQQAKISCSFWLFQLM